MRTGKLARRPPRERKAMRAWRKYTHACIQWGVHKLRIHCVWHTCISHACTYLRTGKFARRPPRARIKTCVHGVNTRTHVYSGVYIHYVCITYGIHARVMHAHMHKDMRGVNTCAHVYNKCYTHYAYGMHARIYVCCMIVCVTECTPHTCTRTYM